MEQRSLGFNYQEFSLKIDENSFEDEREQRGEKKRKKKRKEKERTKRSEREKPKIGIFLCLFSVSLKIFE